MKSETVTGDPAARCADFLDAFFMAPNGTPIDVGIGVMVPTGHPDKAEPAVIIQINGKAHGFTCEEARALAQAAEITMQRFPEFAEGLADLIMAIRSAADAAENEKPDEKAKAH